MDLAQTPGLLTVSQLGWLVLSLTFGLFTVIGIGV